MVDDFYMDILEFYQNPENVKALEAYRKGSYRIDDCVGYCFLIGAFSHVAGCT